MFSSARGRETSPSVYRPLSLLDTIGKGMDALLREFIGKPTWIQKGLFDDRRDTIGYRDGGAIKGTMSRGAAAGVGGNVGC